MALVSELVTKLTSDSSQFSSGVKSAENSVAAFSRASVAHMAKIGLSIAGLVKGYQALSNMVKEVGTQADNAAKLGVDFGVFQALSRAADKAGVSVDNLQVIFSKMNLNVGLAANGAEKQVKAFQALGLSVQELVSMSPDQRYIKIAQAMARIGDETQRSVALNDIFGKSGRAQLALMTTDIQGTVDAYQALGITLSEVQKDNLDNLDEARSLFGDVFGAFFKKTLAELAPSFQAIIEKIQEMILQYGGMDSIAKKVGNAMKDSFDVARNAADRLIAVMLQIQILDAKAALARANTNNSEQGSQFITAQQARDVGIGGSRAGDSQLSFSYLPSINNLRETAPLQDKVNQLQSVMDQTIIDINSKTPEILTSFINPIKKAGDASKEFADAMKSSTDSITSGLAGSKGTSDQIKRIIDGTDKRPTAISEEFDQLASELVNFSQANSGDFYAKRYQTNTLSRLSSMANFAGQQGEDSTAMREAVKQLTAFVQKQQTDQAQKLEITVTPTQYAHIEWSLSPENKKIVDNYISDKMAQEARSVAR